MNTLFGRLVRLAGLVAALQSATVMASQAQPVPIPEDPSVMPQLEVDGVGIGTLNYGNPIESGPNGGTSRARAGIDFSDSALMVGGAQRLYQSGGIGSMGFGILLPDESNSGLANPIFIHQAFLDYQTQTTEWLIGRSDNRSSHLVDFPTLREEDLITFTNPLDPFSNGQNVEEHRYSNVASFSLNQSLAYFEGIHVQHLIDSTGASSSPSSINSFGVDFQYLSPAGMESFARIVSYGVGYEHEFTEAPVSKNINQIYAGGILNLNESVTDRVDFRVQDIVNFGSDLSQFQTLADSYRASYNSIAASIRYLNSPFGKPGYQLALTGGYRNFFQVAGANSFGLALTALKRLGEGFDLVVQYRAEWRDTNLAAQNRGQKTASMAEVGLIFNFNSTINRHISPRRTPLNSQHQYIPD